MVAEKIESVKVETGEGSAIHTPPSSNSAIALDDVILRDSAFPRELDKFLAIVPFILVAFAANAVTLSINHDIVGRVALPDLTHTFVPQQDWAYRLGDHLVAFTVAVNALNLLFHRHRLVVARRGAAVLTVVFLFRDVLMSVTGMPPGFEDNEDKCQPPFNATDAGLILHRTMEQLVSAGLQDGAARGYICGDMMFSGHTAVLVVGCYLVHNYTHRLLWPLRLLFSLIVPVGMVAMVVSRAHYTIDVFVSYWISLGFFSIYHAFCEVPRASRLRSSFRRMWWFWAMVWLEEACPSRRLPNTLEWPLPWPNCALDYFRRWNTRHPDY